MRTALAFAIAAIGAATLALPAAAAPLVAGPIATPTAFTNPLAAGCGGSGEASTSSVNYSDGEAEPHLATHPTNGEILVAGWQQDRWSDGGAHGDLFAYSHDGGDSWTPSSPPFSHCTGGTATSAVAGASLAPRPSDYERATDPWVSYGPGGRVHAIGLVFDNSTPRNAVLAAFSDDGGATWSAPRELRFDSPRALGNNFNDKETLTAHPADPDHVYATWQRIVAPTEQLASTTGFENAFGFYSKAWFTRSTNGGHSWEPARAIFDPGRFNQTIGNQVEALPDSSRLINGFNHIRNFSNRERRRGQNVQVLHSPDRGLTWTGPVQISRLRADEVADPEISHPCPGDREPDGTCAVRTGDIIPDFAVDWSDTATRGNVYAVWMDTRFNDPDHNDILLARSEDGGATWQPPVEVDQAPDGVDAFTATIDVDETGRVAVSYYDFREDEPGDAELSTDLWLAHSHDGGETFAAADEVRITPDSFDMRTAPFAGGYFVGDYTGLSHFGSRADVLWVGANDGDQNNRTEVLYRPAG